MRLRDCKLGMRVENKQNGLGVIVAIDPPFFQVRLDSQDRSFTPRWFLPVRFKRSWIEVKR